MTLINKILSKTNLLITSSMGMVTALAWNDAFKNFFSNNPQFQKYGPWIYAFGITIFSVVIVIFLKKVKKMELIKNIVNEEESVHY